jgi:hypothetical protein
LAGSADEMGDFVMMLKADAITNQSNKNEIEKLKQQIANSSLAKAEKEDFERSLGNISLPNYSDETIKNLQTISRMAVDSDIWKRINSNLPRSSVKTYKKIIPKYSSSKKTPDGEENNSK